MIAIRVPAYFWSAWKPTKVEIPQQKIVQKERSFVEQKQQVSKGKARFQTILAWTMLVPYLALLWVGFVFEAIGKCFEILAKLLDRLVAKMSR